MRFLLVAFLLMALCSCGDLEPVSSELKESYRFYYGYSISCRNDSFGSFDCDDIQLTSMRVSIEIDDINYAYACFGGHCETYDPFEYGYGHDPNRNAYYYQFENDFDETTWTVYTDGISAIFEDNRNGYAVYYSVDGENF
ncbi:MAG: hypothetical protein HUK21_05760 [Fibrobacteraceae bacterium]|nr:hypothetical protein [Fibrobacteraceae bacterium]